MKVAIIGCGLIGHKRLKALKGHELVSACDVDIARAKQLCEVAGSGKPTAVFQEALESNADIAIISTTNNFLTPISIAALKNGMHVLVEKPAARNVAELNSLINAAQGSNKLVKVGFSLRYHPAFSRAREIVDNGQIGPLMFVRGRYGHGGRIGYDREWRADKEISGGGELLDQGIHLIDLSRWFLGDFTKVNGIVNTAFWDMKVEDNGFVSLVTAKNQVAWLHASCSEWKNIFCFEIYGKTGKLQIDGLGGSYGTEKLTFYKMLPQMGPPQTNTFEFPGEDVSWQREFDAFISSIEQGINISGNLDDTLSAMTIIETIYKNSSEGIQ